MRYLCNDFLCNNDMKNDRGHDYFKILKSFNRYSTLWKFAISKGNVSKLE